MSNPVKKSARTLKKIQSKLGSVLIHDSMNYQLQRAHKYEKKTIFSDLRKSDETVQYGIRLHKPEVFVDEKELGSDKDNSY